MVSWFRGNEFLRQGRGNSREVQSGCWGVLIGDDEFRWQGRGKPGNADAVLGRDSGVQLLLLTVQCGYLGRAKDSIGQRWLADAVPGEDSDVQGIAGGGRGGRPGGAKDSIGQRRRR